MVWAPIIAGGIAAGKAIKNARAKKKAKKRARKLGEEAQQYYEEVPALTAEQLQYQPTQFGESQMASAAADPQAIEAQKRALAQMQDIYAQGGYTAAERAQIDQTLAASAQQEASQRAAVQQQMASRGMGGSGAELAGALSAAQGGAETSRLQSGQIAAAGQMRALDALAASAGLGSEMRGQSFNEASTRGQGADRARAYDIESLNAAERWNANAYADAAQFNLNRASRRADTAMGRSQGEQAREGQAWQSQENQTDRWLEIMEKAYQGGTSAASGGATGGTGGGAPF